MVALGLAAVLATVLTIKFTESHKLKVPPTKNSYVVFELDSNSRTVTTAWATWTFKDSIRTVNNKEEHYIDTALYVWWPLVVVDSLRRTIKGRNGLDSTIKQWVVMRKGAFLKDLGLPVGGTP